MDLLDEFKYQSYKSRITILKGSKQPLVDLLKELVSLYGENAWATTTEHKVSNFYFILLYNLIVNSSKANRTVPRKLDKHISPQLRNVYRGLNESTIQHWDTLLLTTDKYSWSLMNWDELNNLNNLLGTVPVTSLIELDFYHMDKLGSLVPLYGEQKRKIIYEYIKLKLGADAPILNYYKLDPNISYKNELDPQVFTDLAQAITNLKELK